MQILIFNNLISNLICKKTLCAAFLMLLQGVLAVLFDFKHPKERGIVFYHIDFYNFSVKAAFYERSDYFLSKYSMSGDFNMPVSLS